jgi:hypothetical protein
VALAGVGVSAAILAGTGEVGGPQDTQVLRWLAVLTTAVVGGASLLLARRWSIRDAAAERLGQEAVRASR